MSFRDYFSGVAAEYAAVRPVYPDSLFAYLASIVPARRLAWDCATGSGQAAVGLARHFDRVIASDASASQIAKARPNDRIEYRVAAAQHSGLEADSVDLITVAQAAHWFDLPPFYEEVRRVGRTNAVIALWTYGYVSMTPEIDRVILAFGEGTLHDYWPPGRRAVMEKYRTLPFPFAEVEAPVMYMERPFTLPQVAEFYHSWSATARYIEANREDPVPAAIAALATVWGDPDTARVGRWEITFRIGRVEK